LAQRRIPFPLGSQNQLDDLPDCSLPTGGTRHVCGPRGYFRGSIRYGNRKSHAAEDRQILHVVSDVTHALLRQSRFSKNLVESRRLLAAEAVIEKVHLQFFRPSGQGGGTPPRN